MSVDREENVYRAKLAEQAERYDGENFEIFPCSDIEYLRVTKQ